MTSSSLSAATIAEVSGRLEEYGSSLSGQHREAIQALLEALEAGLYGTLEPYYYLSAIDPGIGKSLSVASFLKAWKDRGFTPSSSVLIGLSRLQEIEVYIRAAGLDREDVAVLTRSDEHNELGVPQDRHGSAPVMFTTQQMIERRTRGKSFAEATEFHFRGQPRTLRIWDESLIPAEQLVLTADDLGRLPSALRRRHPDLAAGVWTFLMQLGALGDAKSVLIPENLAAAPGTVRSLRDVQLANILDVLSRLAGQEVLVSEDGNGGLQLTGASQPLPSDFPPVIILDASGRVRSTYRLWEEAGGPLRRLPSAAKDYGNLRIHVWQRAVGKVALQEPGAVEDVVKAIAEVLQEDPASDWLIVSYKDHPVDGLLREAVKVDLGERLRFLTWGTHHGTNAFADCRKVVLIGQLNYGASGYRTLAAACGAPDPNPATEEELRNGEYRHNHLQALTRASVRKSRNGIAGTCTAYVIASPNVGATELLTEVFPGCTIERWAPEVPKSGGRAGQLIELLQHARASRAGRVLKAELREALGLQQSNFSRLLGHPDVRRYMDRHGLWADRSTIHLPPGFDPIPGGGFTVADLDNAD